jgi:ParB-like chromosome segregation protein Spo0J
MRYELHPACAVWPEMQPEALQELADDIALNGLHEPLTLAPDGRLLDGRNRALACELVGVEPSTVVYDGDPALFSLSKNKHRRHMTQDQIALVAATLATRPLGANQYEGGSNELPSIAEAAAAVGVPETAVKSAKAVLRDGSPEEIEAVKTGKAKLRATADALRARKKPQPPPTAPRPSARSGGRGRDAGEGAVGRSGQARPTVDVPRRRAAAQGGGPAGSASMALLAGA